MADEKMKVKCPHCGADINLVRNAKGRWICTLGGFTVGAIIGGIIGTTIGIATGGSGMAATIPLGIALGGIVGGGGYIIGDTLVDGFKCPKCKKQIRL